LIDGYSAGYAQHKLQQFYVGHLVAPPIDGHADDMWVWLIDVRDLCALLIPTVWRTLDAFVLRLLIDRHVGLEQTACYLFKAVAVISLVDHGL